MDERLDSALDSSPSRRSKEVTEGPPPAELRSNEAGPTGAAGSDQELELLELARRALPKAYAPYSGFRVGAAVLTHKGNVYIGVNVENASYGLTTCAERSAIFSAVAAEGGSDMEIEAIAIVCETPVECAPCGACRQVIHEFGPSAAIYFGSPHGAVRTTASELLPRAFRLT